MSARKPIAVSLVLFAGLLALGIFITPYADDWTARADIVEAALDGPGRMQLGGLLIAVSFGFGVTAMTGLRRLLHEVGDDTWSLYAVPLISVGSMLLISAGGAIYLGAPAMVQAADEGTAEEVLSELATPVEVGYLVGSLLFGAGWVLMMLALRRTGAYPRLVMTVAVAAVAVFALLHFVPTGWALWAHAVTGLFGFGIVAWLLWADATSGPPGPANASRTRRA